MKRTALRMLVFRLGLVACAGTPPYGCAWWADGVLASDETWSGRDGPFLTQLVLTDEAKELHEFWNETPGNTPSPSLHLAAPGTKVETVVFFVGCEPDEDGNCSVWGTASVEASDGRVLANRVKVPLWVGRPPPLGKAFAMSEHGVGLVVEDLAVSYTFTVVVIDRVARREVPLVRELRVGRVE